MQKPQEDEPVHFILVIILVLISYQMLLNRMYFCGVDKLDNEALKLDYKGADADSKRQQLKMKAPVVSSLFLVSFFVWWEDVGTHHPTLFLSLVSADWYVLVTAVCMKAYSTVVGWKYWFG